MIIERQYFFLFFKYNCPFFCCKDFINEKKKDQNLPANNRAYSGVSPNKSTPINSLNNFHDQLVVYEVHMLIRLRNYVTNFQMKIEYDVNDTITFTILLNILLKNLIIIGIKDNWKFIELNAAYQSVGVISEVALDEKYSLCCND